MTVTFLWGGCISCDQFFMFPRVKTDCCHKGACEKPRKDAPAKTAPTSCEKMPLDHQSSANPHGAATAKLIQLSAIEPPPLSGFVHPLSPFDFPPAFLQPIIGSPPDLRVLNCSFLI